MLGVNKGKLDGNFDSDCILAYLVGALADGSLCHNAKYYIYRVSYYQKKKQYLATCIEPCILALFNKRGHYYHDRRNDVFFYEITSKVIYQEILSLVESFKSQSQRRVPRWILNGKQNVRFAFIRGFFDADGCYKVKPNDTLERVLFGQADRGILEDVRNLLKQEGFKCGKISGPYLKTSTAKPYYYLYMFRHKQIRRFHRMIKPCHPNKQLAIS